MNNLEIKNDGKGNPYIEVYNVRITLVKKSEESKDWDSTGHYLRFCALTTDGNPMPGPELPIANDANVMNLIRAVVILAEQVHTVPLVAIPG